MEEDREVNSKSQSSEEPQNEKQYHFEDRQCLQFLDSLDDYLCQMDSLSLILRQGWFELASARHSMGVTRVNGSLLDQKPHSAPTSLHVTQDNSEATSKAIFTLHKWGSTENGSGEGKLSEEKLSDSIVQLRHRSTSHLTQKTVAQNGASLIADDQVQRERFKSLSVFGTLVSPKLRTSQLSFETALEKLVEIANARSTMLSAFEQVKNELEVEGTDGII